MGEEKTEYRLAFASEITPDSANTFRSRVATILEKGDFASLTILFSSVGGSTDQSIALFNFVSQLPAPVHMHAMGHIGSAAIPVFLAANERTCGHHARFFVHEYDWGFSERQTLHRIDEAVKRLRSDIELARKIIESRTEIPADVLKALDGGAPSTIIAPEQAKAFKIVNKICELSTVGKIAVWTV
jgi:ATP-dependent Clp protease protease subunit